MLKNETLAYWCIVKNSELLLENGSLPLCSEKQLSCLTDHKRQIGVFLDIPVYWLEAGHQFDDVPFSSLRTLLNGDSTLFALAGSAIQFSFMLKNKRFCGCCGQATELAVNTLAMYCSKCDYLHYPQISPCIIVAVRCQDKLLLVQHPRHKNGMYTVIAGFVEPGETLEQCVAREVKEETGITIKNIRYFGSQPWAFPSNLMAGFTAEYVAGELKPDYQELTDAMWVTIADLPKLAPKGTIARELIDFSFASDR